MNFPESYFEDEVRDGFYVPGMMKRSWAAQLEMLDAIQNVCEKHQIAYFALASIIGQTSDVSPAK